MSGLPVKEGNNNIKNNNIINYNNKIEGPIKPGSLRPKTGAWRRETRMRGVA